MKDDEVLAHVNQLKRDMNISRGMMTKLGSGRSSRDLLNFLLGKKAAGGFTEAERADLLSDSEEEPEVDEELTETEIDEATGAEIDMAEIETKNTVIDVEVVKPGKKKRAAVKPKPKAKVAVKAKAKVAVKVKPKARVATASA